MFRRTAQLASIVFTIASVAGCDLLDPNTYLPPGLGGEGEGEADSCDGPDDLGLTVATDSLTPSITFTGTAAGFAVSLPAPESGTRLWVLSQITTPFASPVTYGTVPADAIQAEPANNVPAVALEAGTEYWITLTAGDGNSAECAAWTTP